MYFLRINRISYLVLITIALASAVFAQDYRGKVQGLVTDGSGAPIPGAKVVLTNNETNVDATVQSNDEGRYIFNFVEPGNYTVTAEKDGFKKTIQQKLVVQIQGNLTADLKLSVGEVTASVTVEDSPASVQFNSSGSNLTLDNTTIDQMPVRGRNPYNIITLDPAINGGENNNGENRPYHHAYANEVDSGGQTFRANEVQLNGVALTSSYKVAYTPSVDAVKEVTFSRSIVDSEQGFSSGGTIALNMKSGGSKFNGAGYYFKRDPRFNAFGDPTIFPRISGANEKNFRGTDLSILGGNVGGPIFKKKLFFFTSYEKWNDSRPITVRLNVPTAAERQGDFSQSGLAIYNPFTSTSNASTRTQFTGNIIPQSLWDPVGVKLLALIPLPNAPGQQLNWQGSKNEITKYWNLSTRVDWNISEKLKTFFSYGQFKASPKESNPTDKALFPLNGSNRFGLNLSADAVYILNANTVLNVRGGYFRLTDEFANSDTLLGASGLTNLWGSNTFYSSLYTSDQIYYPAIDVRDNGGSTYRFGRPGREFWQHPEGYNGSVKINTSLQDHSIKYGGEYRVNKGKAARFEPLNFTFRSELTAIRQTVSGTENLQTGSAWASFLIGALQNSSSGRRVPVQEVVGKGYALYIQDDWKFNNDLTLNLGIRWEYEPGPVDAQNRLSQRLDLTSPIPEVGATPPPAFDPRVTTILGNLRQGPTYNGAWIFANKDNRNAWSRKPTDFLPRIGVAYRIDDKTSLRAGWARYIQPSARIRDSLGDFVDAYTGFSTVTSTLNPTFTTTPANNFITLLSNPFPTSGVAFNPIQQPTGQTLGRYTGLGNAVNFDEFDQSPPINDKFTAVFQREIWNKMVFSVDYFFNYGTRLPQTIDLNSPNVNYLYAAPRADYNFTVTNPFRNYLTPSVFPGALRNLTAVAATQLLRPYPMYQAINQTNTDLRKSKIHSLKIQIQQPAYKGLIFTVAYAINDEKTKEAFDDLSLYIGQYSWIPTDAARHRITNVITWDIPIGKGKALLSDAPKAVDYILGGWRLSNTSRYYTGRLLRFGFGTKLNVSGNPVLANPTNDRWFDTSVFTVVDESVQLQRRTNPWTFKGLVGPSTFQTDATLTKSFKIRENVKLEGRLEVYNVLNNINWENPNVTLGNANFGKVNAKRGAYVGREVQYGLRLTF
jgi:Carboxypeptidase regulatory-like domain/TonB dependent receptor